MSANDRQVAGTHYAGHYQHWDFVTEVLENRYMEGQISRYVSRHRNKDGKVALEKAGHYIEKLIEETRSEAIVGFSRPYDNFLVLRTRTFAETYELTESEFHLMTALASWKDINDLFEVKRRFIDTFNLSYPA